MQGACKPTAPGEKPGASGGRAGWVLPPAWELWFPVTTTTGQAALDASLRTPPSCHHTSHAAQHQPKAALLSTSFSAYVARGGGFHSRSGDLTVPRRVWVSRAHGLQVASVPTVEIMVFPEEERWGHSTPQSYEVSIHGVRCLHGCCPAGQVREAGRLGKSQSPGHKITEH